MLLFLVTEGFWELVTESIFTEVLVACNKFTTLHSKFVQANLQNVSKDILLVSFKCIHFSAILNLSLSLTYNILT